VPGGFYKITGKAFFIVGVAPAALPSASSSGERNGLKAAFVDGFHESFMRGDNAFFQQCQMASSMNCIPCACRKQSRPAAFVLLLHEDCCDGGIRD